MSKHTPGPWSRHCLSNDEAMACKNSETGKFFVFRNIYIGSKEKVIGEIQLRSAAERFPHVETEEELEANANLICAAPLMLAALEAALELADRNASRHDGDPMRTDECQACYDQCKAAIAAAKGEQP